MASVRKKGKVWYHHFTDADGKRHELPGCTDKRETEALLADARAQAAKVRNGYIDNKAVSYRGHESKPLTEHIDAWQAALVAQGFAAKHAEHTSNRVRRLVAMMLGAKEALIDGSGRFQTDADVITRLDTPTCVVRLTLENKGQDGDRRGQTVTVVEEAPPGFEPGMKVLQTSAHRDVKSSGKGTSHSIKERFSPLLPQNSPLPPDLAAIVDAWPKLPKALKAGIVAMVKAATGKGE